MNYKILLVFLVFLIQSCSKNSIVKKKYLYPEDLVVAYSFLGNADDVSPNNRDGIVNGPTLTEDRKGRANSAYYFNGRDNFIQLDQKNDFALTDKGCVMAWVKPEYTGDNVAILSNGTSNSPKKNCYNLVLNRYGSQWELLAYIGGKQVNKTPNPILHDYNQWYFIVYQWEKNGNVSLYTNGVLEFEQKISGSTGGNNNTDLRIGHLSLNGYFKGVIDELIVSKRIFSESEINKIYNSTK